MTDRLKPFFIRAQDVPESMRTPGRSLRALLIQPPTRQCVRSYLPHVEEEGEGIGYKPPLGILYVGTNLARHTRHRVQLIDAIAEELSFEQVVERAVAFRPDVVGISAWTDFWYPAYRTGELIKQALPEVHLTYGGPHLGVYAAETLQIPFVDSVIVGDGETPFLGLCNQISNGVVDNSMPGLHLAECGLKTGAEEFFIEGDLESIPPPDRRLLPIELYGSVLGKSRFVTTMVTSRGCPHRCTFCKLTFQKNLARSAESVVEEFREIRELGITEVEVYDDTFTWGRRRLQEICEGLIKAELGITFAVRDRVSSSSVTPEMLDLMYRAGCRRIHYGIESGVQRVIDRMKKRITLEQARNAVKLAKQARMTVLAYFMFGNLDESLQDMYSTIEFAKKLDPHYAQFSITIPYAGTEMYREGLETGVIEHDYWGDYARNPVPDFLPPLLIETGADTETLKRIRNEAVRSFYFRPRYVLRELRKLSSFHEFVRKARMGLQLAESVFGR